MRVLLSAFACAPGFGSEPNVGWEIVRQVSKVHEVWVLTHVNNRTAIQRGLTASALPGVHFLFIGLPWFLEKNVKKPWYHHLYYITWQFEAFRAARRIHREIAFDMVHHVTYVNSWLPSWMGWIGAPFLWSAGIRDRTPRRFLKHMSRKSRIWEVTRNILMNTLGTFTHFLTATRASLILSSSDLSLWKKRLPLRRFLHGALTPMEFRVLDGGSRPKEDVLRIASAGRLMGLKGFSLSLAAFAEFYRECPTSEYWIVGDGPEREVLREMAIELGCERGVRFPGWLPRAKMLDLMSHIDILIHPSFHEQFAYVLLEAMAAGIPVICLDVGGPSMLVTDGCGLKIPMSTPSKVIHAIHQGLRLLAADPSKRKAMGQEGRRLAYRSWNWDAVGQSLLEIYENTQTRHP